MITTSLLVAGGLGVASASAAEKKNAAPAAVREAVMAAHPDARITSIKPEKEEIDQFEVEFTETGKKMGADVAPDGTILEIEEPLKEDEVPAAAKEAIMKAAEGGTIKGYEKATITAKPDKEKNTATKLDAAEIQYEADLSKEGASAEVAVTADGKVVEAPKWKKKENKEKDEKSQKDEKSEKQ